MKRLLIWLTFSFIVCGGFGQSKQNFTWKFGATGAGLDFAHCTPNVLIDGINNGIPFEGQSAISDNLTGKLLLYTDGYNIYDSTNNVMQNGTAAGLNNSLTQTIIVKKPGSNTLFYVFTPDMQGGLVYNMNFPNSRGVNYAEVDMSLNNGLGSVTSTFNSLKDTSNCEQLTAIYHSNGEDIWLVGHEYGNNNFYAFLISNSGINSVPVISSAGPTVYTWQSGSRGSSNLDAIGELKASASGNKLAFTTYYNGITCLVDFDKSTGIISNPIPLTIEAGGYGVSFSPDNSKLYIAGVDTTSGLPSYPANGKIYQFDISSNNQTMIQNSRTTIYTDPDGGFRSLKLGVDGKIYVARIDNSGYGEFFLGVINNPNSTGMACNYVHDGIYIDGLRGRWGLNNSIEDKPECEHTAISEIQQTNSLVIAPNPFSSSTVLQTAYGLNAATITIYNSSGQPVKQINNISGQTITVLRDNLPCGMYFILLTDNNKVISTDKLVITD